MYYVYILQSLKDSKFYTGLAKDVPRRLSEHNGGFVKPTKGRRPLKLVYTEKFKTLAEARSREKFFKTGSGREFREEILKQKHIPR
ncbi:MAG: GIY-YIG nuclease family protein [bacterium]